MRCVALLVLLRKVQCTRCRAPRLAAFSPLALLPAVGGLPEEVAGALARVGEEAWEALGHRGVRHGAAGISKRTCSKQGDYMLAY